MVDSKVSIIIPHHNNFDILIECINSIKKIQHSNVEIIIVDNNSSDNSINKIRDSYTDLIIQKSKKNLGYAGGCNLGAKIAQCKYLLFLNNDTIHEEFFLDHLISKIYDNNNIACVQPKIKNYDNKEYFDYAGASGGFIDYLVFPFTRGRIFNTIEKDTGQYDYPTKVFWTSGTAFITSKDIFNKLGGFDENLFSHMEEIDYCWKCYLAGFECWVEPKSVVYHHGAKTLTYNSYKKTYLNHRNSIILLLSNYSIGLSLYLVPLRLLLEVISSLNDLLKFRIGHFIAHYFSIISVLFNITNIYKRRKKINKIRIKDDKFLFDKNIIFNQSAVRKYFLFRKKTYNKFFNKGNNNAIK